MKRCIIIGGGLSGLATGVYLSEKGADVLLLEASPKLGGRAYSFDYNGENVDNGQHLMMGCYNYTLDFLKKINCLNLVEIQNSFELNFVDRKQNHFQLKSNGALPYPFNLLSGTLNYKALLFSERLALLNFFKKIYFLKIEDLDEISVSEWLKKNNQSENIIKSFWIILIEGALNTSLENASAKSLAIILKQMFFSGNNGTKFVIPKVGLSKLYCDGASEFIDKNGGEVRLSERVINIESEKGRISKVITTKNEYNDFDVVISAIPPFMLGKIVNENFNDLDCVEYSSIISIHIWLEDNPFEKEFYGLIASPVHWIFNKGKYITTVTSNSDDLVGLSNKEIADYFIKEIEEYFPFKISNKIANYKVVKEKRATFIPSPGTEKIREDLKSPFENFILSGDFSFTGLPSTIEGAVKSGKMAADLVMMGD